MGGWTGGWVDGLISPTFNTKHTEAPISLVTLISREYICELLLYGNPKYDSQTNKIISESAIGA